jgi:hypothetical protein
MAWFINYHGSKTGYFFSVQNAVRASRQNKIFCSFILWFANNKNTRCFLSIKQGWANLLNIEDAYSNPLTFGNRTRPLDGVFRRLLSIQHSLLYLSAKRDSALFFPPSSSNCSEDIHAACIYVCMSLSRWFVKFIFVCYKYNSIIWPCVPCLICRGRKEGAIQQGTET